MDQRSLASGESPQLDAASSAPRTESASRVTPGGRPTEAAGSGDGHRRRRDRRKLRARRVERIVRRVDPWSVLKLTFLFYLCLWLILLLAGVILWLAASSAGAIDNVEDFMTELFGLESFEFEGQQIFRGALVGGFILVLVGSGFSVLLSVLFNLIGDLTGGIRISVIELENLRRRPSRSGESRRDQDSGSGDLASEDESTATADTDPGPGTEPHVDEDPAQLPTRS